MYIGKMQISVIKKRREWTLLNKHVGPFADSMKKYKMTASFFGICGIIAVPSLISTGQAPVLSVALGKNICTCIYFVIEC